MARNVPNPGDTIVPGARAERRRMFIGDSEGIVIYAVAVIAVAAAILLVTAFAEPAAPPAAGTRLVTAGTKST